jgi:hypothetical protein
MRCRSKIEFLDLFADLSRHADVADFDGFIGLDCGDYESAIESSGISLISSSQTVASLSLGAR